jgi:hypothetical protein
VQACGSVKRRRQNSADPALSTLVENIVEIALAETAWIARKGLIYCGFSRTVNAEKRRCKTRGKARKIKRSTPVDKWIKKSVKSAG